MNEIQINDFDYSIVDRSTAEYLESKSFVINGIAENMRMKIGKELKEVQDQLANNYQGVFAKWYTSLGLDKNTVYYWINAYEFSRNLEDTKQLENFQSAPKSLQVETMKKNAPDELVQKVLDGDITTNKKYIEIKKALKEKESELEQTKADLEQAETWNSFHESKIKMIENRKPETVEVIKEVVPEDVQKQIEEKDRFLRIMKRDMDKKEEELRLLKSRADYSDNLQKREQEIKGLQFEADKTVLVTKLKMDEFLKEVAITAFRKGAIAASSEGTRKKLQQGVEELKAFCTEMELALSGRIELSKQGGTEYE